MSSSAARCSPTSVSLRFNPPTSLMNDCPARCDSFLQHLDVQLNFVRAGNRFPARFLFLHILVHIVTFTVHNTFLSYLRPTWAGLRIGGNDHHSRSITQCSAWAKMRQQNRKFEKRIELARQSMDAIELAAWCRATPGITTEPMKSRDCFTEPR